MSQPLRINLALQGGGAHGAFTWGVLDRLLDDEGIEVAGISGTSAGALNGAAFKAGIVQGGREGARENLDWLWGQVGAMEDLSLGGWMAPWLPTPGAVSKALEFSPFYAAADVAGRMFSPYLWGPLADNPLRRIVGRFRFDDVCGPQGPALFVCATNVRTGKVRVFSGDEISTDAILASACLPTLFPAVQFTDPRTGETEAFWDGGYTGNPALHPLYDPALPDDIVIVNINPLERSEVPVSARDIQNRINEISFNASLLRDLRAIQFVRNLIAEGAVKKGAMKDVLVHMIADDELMRELSVATKLIPNAYLLARLKKAGRRAADRFLADHRGKLGIEASTDLAAMFT